MFCADLGSNHRFQIWADRRAPTDKNWGMKNPSRGFRKKKKRLSFERCVAEVLVGANSRVRVHRSKAVQGESKQPLMWISPEKLESRNLPFTAEITAVSLIQCHLYFPRFVYICDFRRPRLMLVIPLRKL